VIEAAKIQGVIHFQFKQPELLEQALTHRSYSKNINNERLEFLGDSVLSLTISDNIYTRLPNATEGELSRIRASLVKEEALATVARDINLGEYIRLGAGEMKSGGFRRSSILSDALEALFGAIYLDAGYQQVSKTILFLYEDYLVTLPSPGDLKDPKTSLQETLQGKKMTLPEYRVVKTVGKAHNQTFTVNCEISDLKVKVAGTGSSRKRAEQMAASRALEEISG